MVVWTEKASGNDSTGWLPLLVAFLIGVVATTAVHRYVIYPVEAASGPRSIKAPKKQPKTGRVPASFRP